MSRLDEPFFIGFVAPPRGLRGFLIGAVLVLAALFAGLGWLLAATQDDPGDGAFRFDWQRQTLTGILEASPYPMVHVLEGTEHVPAGRTIMLSGGGKRGVQDRAAPLDGQTVTVSGVALNRGDLLMLQLRNGTNGIDGLTDAAAHSVPAPVPAPVPLGRWRLVGEICDGKCYAGAMRPGTGLAHKACAILCLDGGVPPVFVATDEVEGAQFMMLAGPDGGAVPDAVLQQTAILVTADGEIERRGDLLVFRIDPDSVVPAQ